MSKHAWEGQYKAFNEALKYMLDRQSGKENQYIHHGQNLMML